MMWRCI